MAAWLLAKFVLEEALTQALRRLVSRS
jgi:hypothetical protein